MVLFKSTLGLAGSVLFCLDHMLYVLDEHCRFLLLAYNAKPNALIKTSYADPLRMIDLTGSFAHTTVANRRVWVCVYAGHARTVGVPGWSVRRYGVGRPNVDLPLHHASRVRAGACVD
jgi:hypothetical protein